MPFTDLRYTLRLARRSPFVTAVTLLILAGGISITTAVFGLVNAVWLRPLPYPEAHQLVAVTEFHPRHGDVPLIAPSTYAAWREAGAWASDVGAAAERDFALGRPGAHAEHVRGMLVEPALLRMLGAKPLAGRLLVAADERPGANRAAVVSERFWRRRLAASPSAIGATIRLDGAETVIVGVLPYAFKLFNSAVDVFATLPAPGPADAGRSLSVIARLAPGQTIGRAAARLALAAASRPRPATDDDGAWTPRLKPLDAVLWGDARPAYLLLLTAAGLLLALIAANVSNLLLARSEARRHEFSLRLALGAGRSGIIRQLLTEGLALAALSCALASVFCLWLQHLLRATVPEMTEVRLDATVFGFAAFISIAAGLAFGFIPAWSVLRQDAGGAYRADVVGGTARRRTGRVLAAAQLAAATALLVSCGLLVRAAIGIRNIDPGFDTARLLTASISLPGPRYPNGDRRSALYADVARDVRALPGVERVAFSSRLPLDGGIDGVRLDVEGRSPRRGESLRASTKAVTGGYLETLGLSLIAGEGFHQGAHGEVMINQTLARAVWKSGAEAIGARLRVDGGAWRRVVGVVADARQVLTDPVAPEFYVPLDENPPSTAFVLIRTRTEPLSAAQGLAAVVRRLDPDLPVSDVWSMTMIADSYVPGPFVAAFTLLSAIGLLLSALGLYAVIAFHVTRRVREFGIRLALGAGRRRILGLIVWEGLRVSAAGLLPGGIAAVALGFVLSRRFAGVAVVDPAVLGVVILLVAAVSVAACVLPGRRATRVEPSVALRCE